MLAELKKLCAVLYSMLADEKGKVVQVPSDVA